MKTLSYIKPKFFETLKGYTLSQLTKDIVAGVIVAIIALPLSIALAIASGVNPEQGLYTAIFAGFFISLLGGSRVQIGGPTAAFVVIIYGIIADYGPQALTVATLLAGIIMILMGLFKLGNLIKFIPKTITVGFTFGIAIGIFAGQLKDFFGLQMGAVPSEFIEKMIAYGENLHTLHLPTLAVGAAALLIQIFWPKVSQKIPGSLVAIVVTTLAVSLFKLPVATIGDLYTIKPGFPAFTVPEINLSLIKELISPAFTIAILASIESLLSCVVSDGMIGDKHSSNAELVGQGVGSIMSSLFGGIPATGAIARTAANVKNGGRTPVAGMVHALTLLLIVLFLMPYASLIPMTTLAAILIMVAYNMSSWRTFVHMVKTAPKSDILVLVLTFLLTVIFDLVVAIEVGMVLAALLFMSRMSDTSKVREWDDVSGKKFPSNTAVYDFTGPIFFGSTSNITNLIKTAGKSNIILRMGAVPSIDASGLDVLEQLHASCKKSNVRLILSHVNEQPMKLLKKSGFVCELGEENLFANIDNALSAIREE